MRASPLAVLAGITSIFLGIAVPAQSTSLPATLADATAAIVGIESGGLFGGFVDNGGDLTGDGIDDLVVGARGEADGGGRVYVFEGGRKLAGELSSEKNAFASFEGEPCAATEGGCTLLLEDGDRVGTGGIVGDVDGDGNADLVVTGYGIDHGDQVDAGGAHIFYGPLEEGTLEPHATLLGESAFDQVGANEVEVGRVDNDDYPDIVIGAGGHNAGSGSVYIVYGDGSRLSRNVSLAARAVELSGTPGVDGGLSGLGRRMAIGELDGSRAGSDLVICAASTLAVRSRCYIIYGEEDGRRLETGPIEDVADASIIGDHPGSTPTGEVVAAVADHDADGLDDIIIGEPFSEGSTGYSAIFYSYRGPENPLRPSRPLAGPLLRTQADATIKGNGIGDSAGWHAAAGDLNADGVTDIVLTTLFENVVVQRGALYVFYGKAGSPLQADHLINPLTMSHADVTIASEHPGDSVNGWWFEARGDVTGDGVDDLVIGAPLGCDDSSFQGGACTVAPGATYVVAGIGPPAPLEVSIDIKPGSNENRVNTNGGGSVPVAIITSDAFDALSVEVASVTFGPASAAPTRSTIEDVDHDGDLDLLLHFDESATGLQPRDDEACLEGATSEGHALHGCDRVDVR